jgi:hypothetical protein
MKFCFVLAACLYAAAAGAEVRPVDAAQCAAMKAHHILNPGAPVGCERLAVVTFAYVDFAGATHADGRVVVLDAVAPSVERIFQALYAQRFPITQAVPVEAYNGNDEDSMAADNTSGFNVRIVADTTHLSLHAYGAALDINPVENPYLTMNGATVRVAPPAGVAHLNRALVRPGKPLPGGYAEAVVEIFADNGFAVWGGDWDDPIDYQHFDIGRGLAERLVALPPDAARVLFDTAANAYRQCVAQHADKLPRESRQICVGTGDN